MSDGNITTKTVAVQPGDFQMKEMIEHFEPFIDSLPHFLRGLIENYNSTSEYNERIRRAETRAKSKTPTDSERKQWEKCKEELRQTRENHASELSEQKQAFEALLEKTKTEFKTKLEEKDEYKSTTANEKRKKRHDDELRRIKEKHELDLSEQRKRLNLQMDKQSDDFDAILQRKLKEKDDYFNVEMSAARAAMDEQEEKHNNYVLQLLDQHHDALLEEKRIHQTQLDQLTIEHQQEMNKQIDVYRKKLVQKEEDLERIKKKISNQEQGQTLPNEIPERQQKEIEHQEAHFKAEIERQAKDFKDKQLELLRKLEGKEDQIRNLQQSMEGTVRKELYQKLEAEHLQKESHMKHFLDQQTIQFGNEKLNLQHEVQDKDCQIKELSTRLKKVTTQSEQMREAFKEELGEKNKELESFMSRLAAVSEKKVRSDQRKVENTLSRHRRSDIEKEFKDFYDQDRMDVCDVLRQCYQKITDEDESIHFPRLACMIFERAYERALSARNGFCNVAQQSILHLVSNAAEAGRRWTVCESFGVFPDFNILLEDRRDIDRSLLEEICGLVEGMMLTVKENADSCPRTLLAKDLKEWVYNTWASADSSKCLPRWAGDKVGKKLDHYFEKCVLLAWRMVTQVPPLQIDFNTGRKYEWKLHEAKGYHPTMVARTRQQHGSGINPEEEIACYLWPILHDEQKVLNKGAVILKLNYN